MQRMALHGRVRDTVVLTPLHAGLYEAIKDAGDRVLGIATQCVDPKKASLVGSDAVAGRQ